MIHPRAFGIHADSKKSPQCPENWKKADPLADVGISLVSKIKISFPLQSGVTGNSADAKIWSNG